MLKILSKFVLWLTGWKAVSQLDQYPDKYIITSAPHTSLWDFVLGRISLWSMGIKCKFLIKKEMFRFPYTHLLRWSGGIPVDRGHGASVVKPIVEIIQRSERFTLLITPEGTRKLTTNWKKGYYFIATTANIPIVLGYIDYQEKVCALSRVFYPTGNYEEDFKVIEDYYRGRHGRHPERFNLS